MAAHGDLSGRPAPSRPLPTAPSSGVLAACEKAGGLSVDALPKASAWTERGLTGMAGFRTAHLGRAGGLCRRPLPRDALVRREAHAVEPGYSFAQCHLLCYASV